MKAKKKQKPGSGCFEFLGPAPALPASIGRDWSRCLLEFLHVPMVFDDLVSIQKNAGVRFGDYSVSFHLLSRCALHHIHLELPDRRPERLGIPLINWLLHIANGILIYFIAKHIFEKSGVLSARLETFAFVSAAFFLVHPIQTGAVTYISSQSGTALHPFDATGFLLFIKRRPERIGLVFSLVISSVFLIGIGAKETVISLPAVLVLYDFLFLSNSQPRKMLARWRFYVDIYRRRGSGWLQAGNQRSRRFDWRRIW